MHDAPLKVSIFFPEAKLFPSEEIKSGRLQVIPPGLDHLASYVVIERRRWQHCVALSREAAAFDLEL